MSLKASLFALATAATLLAGPLAPAHAITGTFNQRAAAKAREPHLAVQCALTPYHILIYNPDPELVGYCQNNKPAPPREPDWGNAGDRSWCGFTCPM